MQRKKNRRRRRERRRSRRPQETNFGGNSLNTRNRTCIETDSLVDGLNLRGTFLFNWTHSIRICPPYRSMKTTTTKQNQPTNQTTDQTKNPHCASHHSFFLRLDPGLANKAMKGTQLCQTSSVPFTTYYKHLLIPSFKFLPRPEPLDIVRANPKVLSQVT